VASSRVHANDLAVSVPVVAIELLLLLGVDATNPMSHPAHRTTFGSVSRVARRWSSRRHNSPLSRDRLAGAVAPLI